MLLNLPFGDQDFLSPCNNFARYTIYMDLALMLSLFHYAVFANTPRASLNYEAFVIYRYIVL